MVDVEERALRAFEQNRGAVLDRAMHHEPHVLGEREESFAHGGQHVDRRLDVGALRAAEGRQLRVRVRDSRFDELAHPRRMPEVEDADAATRDLVLIRRPDSATRRADRLGVHALGVDQLVIRLDEMRAVAHVESPFDVDSVGDELRRPR